MTKKSTLTAHNDTYGLSITMKCIPFERDFQRPPAASMAYVLHLMEQDDAADRQLRRKTPGTVGCCVRHARHRQVTRSPALLLFSPSSLHSATCPAFSVPLRGLLKGGPASGLRQIRTSACTTPDESISIFRFCDTRFSLKSPCCWCRNFHKQLSQTKLSPKSQTNMVYFDRCEEHPASGPRRMLCEAEFDELEAEMQRFVLSDVLRM